MGRAVIGRPFPKEPVELPLGLPAALRLRGSIAPEQFLVDDIVRVISGTLDGAIRVLDPDTAVGSVEENFRPISAAPDAIRIRGR